MSSWLLCGLSIAYLLSGYVAAYNPVPRWGQAIAVINDALYVYGGKTDPSNSYSYSIAPNNNDLLYLSLDDPFDVSSPPWQLVSGLSNSSTSQGPAVSWHTLSAFNTSHVLLFGGQPGPNSMTVLVGLADSAFLLDVFNRLEPAWMTQAASWAGQPIRRIHHTTTTVVPGLVSLVGGQKADGSNNAFSDHYVFQPNTPSFTILPTENGPPDISGHAAIALSDGRLLVFGGYSQSLDLIFPLSRIWVLDTTQVPPTWSLLNVSESSLPAPRRAFAAVLLANGNILIHGGSDAVLQNNFADGWILDTSQNPMFWSKVDILSQLGARRDHFAVSYGDLVIFGFGYGDDAPAPASLQIYDSAKGSFVPTFTPPPPSSSQIQTLPGPSPTSKPPTTSGSVSHTGTFGGVHPTATVGSNPGGSGNGGGDGQGSHGHSRTTAVTVGTILGVLGLLLFGLLATYYIRRRRHQIDSERRFMMLRGDGDEDGENSPHFEERIPAATFTDDRPYSNSQRWGSSVLSSLGLSGLVGTLTGSRSIKNIRKRRDMLADEDTRDFGRWHDGTRRDGTGGSSWSLKSILGNRIQSREPSNASTLGGASRREKNDPFSDEAMLMKNEATSYSGSNFPIRPQTRRQMSYSSSKSYTDPFNDPIQEDQWEHVDEGNNGQTLVQPYLHSTPQMLPSLQTNLSLSYIGHVLSPLSERTSQNTLSINEHPTSVSSHNNSPFDSSSRVTSRTSIERSLSPGPFTSIIGASSPTNPPMRRSDSWWARFSRTSFLERRTSEASRALGGMPEIRDPNPPPRLVAIEESIHSDSPDHHSPKRDSPASRKPSIIYGGHNKSMSSVKTADTEAIDKMARVIDVVQVMGSGSQRTASTGTNASSAFDTRPNSWIEPTEDINNDRQGDIESVICMSPVDIAHRDYSTPRPISSSPPSTSQSQQSSSATKSGPPAPSSTVAARIQQFERRQSQDQDVSTPDSMKQREERRSHSALINYGLIQRPSLYVANPDRRTTSSTDP